jgi:hypothetical protein
MEGIRDCLTDIDAVHSSSINVFNPFGQSLNHSLNHFSMSIPVFTPNKQPIKLKTSLVVIHGIQFDVLKELSPVLIFFLEAEKVTDAVQSFVVTEIVHEFGLPALWDTLQLIYGVVSFYF